MGLTLTPFLYLSFLAGGGSLGLVILNGDLLCLGLERSRGFLSPQHHPPATFLFQKNSFFGKEEKGN